MDSHSSVAYFQLLIIPSPKICISSFSRLP